MYRIGASSIFVITVVWCIVAMTVDSLSDVDLGTATICIALFGILIMLGMIYEELKL